MVTAQDVSFRDEWAGPPLMAAYSVAIVNKKRVAVVWRHWLRGTFIVVMDGRRYECPDHFGMLRTIVDVLNDREMGPLWVDVDLK